MKDPLADACLDCPAGFFCVNDKSQDPEPCPRGFYCPAKTGFDWKPCPKGTYGDSPGLANVTSKCTFIAYFECFPYFVMLALGASTSFVLRC